MSGFRFTAEADRDLDGIVAYIAHDKPRAAARFVDQVERKCRLLAKFPERGERRDDLAPGLRAVSVASYIIFYRIADDGIIVVRVLSGFRDLESFFP